MVNSVINPLTALLDCKNGELFTAHAQDGVVGRVIGSLIQEASKVFQALVFNKKISSEILGEEYVADEKNMKSLLERFSFERLHTMMLDVGKCLSWFILPIPMSRQGGVCRSW